MTAIKLPRSVVQQVRDALAQATPKPCEGDDDYAERGFADHKAAIAALDEALAQPGLPDAFFEFWATRPGLSQAKAMAEWKKQTAPTPELPPLPEPDAYLFQHEETGNTMFVDSQQVEWGFEKNNPRLQKISAVFTADQTQAYARAALELHAKRGSEAPLPDERAAFEDLLDAAEEWERFVDVDRAPMNLRKWLERAALAQHSAEPPRQEPPALHDAARAGLEALVVAFDQTCSVGRPKDWQQIKSAIDTLRAALPEQTERN